MRFSVQEAYLNLIDKLIEGKHKYTEDKGVEPDILIVRKSIKRIIDNMEFFSDHVLIREGKTILNGMRVLESDHVDKGEAIYANNASISFDEIIKPAMLR